MIRIPDELTEQFADGNGALFVGAGLSLAAGLPAWSVLTDILKLELEQCPDNASYPDIAHYYELTHGRRRLVERIRDRLGNVTLRPTSLHSQLIRLPATEIFTTNYDNLIEEALKHANKQFRSLVAGEDAAFWSSDAMKVIKLHGDLSQPSSLVITSEDYENYSLTHSALARLLQSALHTRTVLFVGYSARDSHLRFLLTQVQRELGKHTRNLYALMFEVNKLHLLDMEKRGICVIDLRTETDFSSPEEALGQWLNQFTKALAYPEAKVRTGTTRSVIVEGEIPRTQVIVREVGRFIATVSPTDPSVTVRLRQGFGSFSLCDDEHPNNPEYGNLLREERDAFLDLFQRGYDFRVLVSRRPLLAEDLYQESPECLDTWRKWHQRCQNLIRFIADIVSQGLSDRAVFIYTPYTYLADIALGTTVLVKGTKTDRGPSYKSTIITRDAVQIRQFIDEFEAHMRQRIEDYAAELEVGSVSDLRSELILRHTVEKLEQIRDDIANRAGLLEKVLKHT